MKESERVSLVEDLNAPKAEWNNPAARRLLTKEENVISPVGHIDLEALSLYKRRGMSEDTCCVGPSSACL